MVILNGGPYDGVTVTDDVVTHLVRTRTSVVVVIDRTTEQRLLLWPGYTGGYDPHLHSDILGTYNPEMNWEWNLKLGDT